MIKGSSPPKGRDNQETCSKRAAYVHLVNHAKVGLDKRAHTPIIGRKPGLHRPQYDVVPISFLPPTQALSLTELDEDRAGEQRDQIGDSGRAIGDAVRSGLHRVN